MAQDSNTTTEYKAEVTKADYSETREWEFRADIRVRLHNPEGENVGVVRTYKAQPKFDDVASAEDRVYEFVAYWWTDAYPANGDSSFTDVDTDWRPNADLADGDALLEECIENATFDPQVELESLKNHSERTRRRLEGEEVDAAGLHAGDASSG